MDSDVQKVKDRINIVEIVGQYVQLKKAGRTYMARCPFHKERTPSFHVSAERGTYKCFGCGEGGDVFTFIEKMDGIDFPTALKQLAERAGVKLEGRGVKIKAPEEKEHEERLRDVCESAVVFFENELQKRKDVLDYLKTRGVHDDTVKNWRLGYAPATWDSLSKHLQSIGFKQQEIVDAGFAVKLEKRSGDPTSDVSSEYRVIDRFRGRIMFPIFDPSGLPIAVSGRFFERVPGQRDDGSEPAKYVNSPETALFKKSRTLYGFDRARAAIRKADCILLVEGQFDLILSHQSGLPFTVALSGTALTDEHLILLGRLSKRLVLALDADAAGIKAGLKSALMAIAGGFDVKIPHFPQGQDPADVARENPELLKAAVRTSRAAPEFFMDTLKPLAKDERAYQKLIEAQVLPLVAALHSTIEQEHFFGLVAQKLHVSPEAVKTEVAKIKSKPAGGIEPSSRESHAAGTESTLTPIQKKAGMLIFKFGRASTIGGKLAGLLGDEALGEIEVQFESLGEELRFRFDAEVGENSEEIIAADMLADIERHVKREHMRMKFV